jgi:hypothetical protein
MFVIINATLAAHRIAACWLCDIDISPLNARLGRPIQALPNAYNKMDLESGRTEHYDVFQIDRVGHVGAGDIAVRFPKSPIDTSIP